MGMLVLDPAKVIGDEDDIRTFQEGDIRRNDQFDPELESPADETNQGNSETKEEENGS